MNKFKVGSRVRRNPKHFPLGHVVALKFVGTVVKVESPFEIRVQWDNCALENWNLYHEEELVEITE